MQCRYPGCTNSTRAKGLCVGHYAQRRRGASLEPLQPYDSTIESRFSLKVAKQRQIDGCWLWTGWVGDDGYGRLRVGKTQKLAHVVAWFIEHDTWPDEDLELDHLCRTRRCVRIEHLELVTHAENVQRAVPYRRARRRPV